MALTSILANRTLLIAPSPPPKPLIRRTFHRTTSLRRSPASVSPSQLPKPSTFRIRFQKDGESESDEVMEEVLNGKDIITIDEVVGGRNDDNASTTSRNSLLLLLALALGVAAAVTIASIALKLPGTGSFFGVQFLVEGSQPSVLAAPPVGFTFKAFGYRIVLPEYAPGWLYFWLLMAAGCGLFISEEALNIWVGITLSRTLSLDGTWLSFVESFSRNAPYIMSTVTWVYWGVCISDMIPYYLGKAFRQSGASDDLCSKLGVGREKVKSITGVVQRYGNLVGLVERFSLGVRNPTAFLAGTLGISPECFFGGVCLGGLITLPLQLGIGFLMRERPVFALATVATVVGIWTIFPYAIAAATALFIYIRRRYST